jgi:hypothetical protein
MITKMLAQLRNKAHQGTNLRGIPNASVVQQAANQCLCNLGKYFRDRANALLPLYLDQFLLGPEATGGSNGRLHRRPQCGLV